MLEFGDFKSKFYLLIKKFQLLIKSEPSTETWYTEDNRLLINEVLNSLN